MGGKLGKQFILLQFSREALRTSVFGDLLKYSPLKLEPYFLYPKPSTLNHFRAPHVLGLTASSAAKGKEGDG